MKLTWNGHSCFTFDTDAGVVVFDPYETDYVPGLHLPALAADVVLCSHGHEDHCYPQGVKQTRRAVGFTVETVATHHDEAGGSLRGENTVHIVDVNGFRLAHLGDLGHVLTAEQVQAMGHIDVLLVPVGGYYTIDAKTALELCRLLQPVCAVPMHYRTQYDPDMPVGTLRDFLDLVKAEDTQMPLMRIAKADILERPSVVTMAIQA
jgi:L-ascorbate metabolism protein UlaG (beta-lactamase superfamily)